MNVHTIATLSVVGFSARARGLIGRPAPTRGTALHFRACRCVHTAWMRYSIDVVFVDARCRVIKPILRVPPWRIAFCQRARSVLELAPGEIVRLDIRRGDILRLHEIEENRCASRAIG